MTVPPSADLLLAWDAKRPRSLQTELGISDLGGCRRKAGYILAGTPRRNGHKSLQPVLGTGIHEIIASIADEWAYLSEARTEIPVMFAGIPGHVDLYWPPVVRDVKTVGRTAQLEKIKMHGPPVHDLWQVNTYAAALISHGETVERVQLDYIARDSGEWYLWEDQFEIRYVRDAMAWLRTVRETELDMLARDYRPDSPYCTSCPFRETCWEDKAVDGRDPLSVLYVDEPDAAKWIAALEDGRERRSQAEEDEHRARGALDALRPNDVGTALVEVPGVDGVLVRFTVMRGRVTPDTDQIRADYEAAGGTMPEKTGEPSIRVAVVRKEGKP